MPNVLGIDPYAFLQISGDGAAKVAKPAKVDGVEPELSQLSQLSQASTPKTDDLAPAELSQLSQLSQGYTPETENPPSPLARPDELEERAAITQFGAGVPAAWAEGFARLQTMQPPAGMAEARWWQVMDDAGCFLDRWGATAAKLGWEPHDLFGVDGRAPDARYDLAGLVPLLCGRQVVDVTADGATIFVRPGVTQRYVRRRGPTGVLLWELTENAA